MSSILGGYFPMKLKINEGEKTTDFSSVSNQGMGSVIFIMSERCGTCDYSPINQFIEKYNGFNYMMFLNAPDNSINSIISGLHKNLKIFVSDLIELNNYFGFQTVPFAMGINSTGQIVSCDHFNTLEHLDFILSPLLYVYFSGVEVR